MRWGSMCLTLTLTSQLTIAVHEDRSPRSQVQSWQLVSCQFCVVSTSLGKISFPYSGAQTKRLIFMECQSDHCCCYCCKVASVVSDSVRSHRWQPTRLPIPGILQARTLEWVAISFSNAWKWKVKVKSLSPPHHSPTQIPQWHCSAQTRLQTKAQWDEEMCFWALSPLPCLFTYPHFNKSHPSLQSLAFVPLSTQQRFFPLGGGCLLGLPFSRFALQSPFHTF